MAEHYPSLAQTQIIAPPKKPTTATSALLLRKLQEHVSNSGQLFGILTLVITVAISLFLTGLTVVTAIVGVIFFAPLIIVSSPIWVPLSAVVFVVTAGFLSTCGLGLVVVAVFSWLFRYFRGSSSLPVRTGSTMHGTGFTANRAKPKTTVSSCGVRTKGIDAALD